MKLKILSLVFVFGLLDFSFSLGESLPASEGKVYVCPLATTQEEVNPRCDCRIDLILGQTVTSTCPKDGKSYEMTLTLQEIDGKEYYAILGFENGGAGVNKPPVAKISGPLEGKVGEKLHFSARDSFDENQDPLDFFWDFGDKNVASGLEVWHVFENEGNFEVKLTASDGLASSSATAFVKITSKKIAFGASATGKTEKQKEVKKTKEEQLMEEIKPQKEEVKEKEFVKGKEKRFPREEGKPTEETKEEIAKKSEESVSQAKKENLPQTAGEKTESSPPSFKELKKSPAKIKIFVGLASVFLLAILLFKKRFISLSFFQKLKKL